MTTRTRTGVRKYRHTPARLTARIGYQAAGLDRSGRKVRATYHALTSQTVTVGFLTRHPGQALCGAPGPWADIADGLFPPLLTCRSCQAITARQHITITSEDPAL